MTIDAKPARSKVHAIRRKGTLSASSREAEVEDTNLTQWLPFRQLISVSEISMLRCHLHHDSRILVHEQLFSIITRTYCHRGHATTAKCNIDADVPKTCGLVATAMSRLEINGRCGTGWIHAQTA